MNGAGGLDNPMNWSFGIGQLFNIKLRIHILFVVGAVWLVFSSLSEAGGAQFGGALDGIMTVGLMFLIVLIHEFGHCFGCRSTGGEADEIMMWPLGGLASVRPPHKPQAHFITAVAGPFVNVVFCAVTAAVLILMFGTLGAVPWNPLTMAVSADVFSSTAGKWLVTFFMLNYIILLFNLLPVYPLDGGRVLQSILWQKRGYADSIMLAAGVGMIGAIAFGLLGLVTGKYMLLFIAVFGYMTCYQQRQAVKMGMVPESSGNEFGYDFSKGYDAFNEEAGEPKGFWAKRKAEKKAAKAEWEEEQAEKHAEQIDEILAKIKRDGMGSLTRKEKKILQEETVRKR